MLRYDLANIGDAIYTAGLVVNGTNLFVEVGAGTREVVFERVHPFDWDMDGIPNVHDGTPRVPSSNAGFNQTDEWAAAAFSSNATTVLRVDVRTGLGGAFGSEEVKWKWISGPCTVESNGWYAVVTPSATNGEVEVEARFNEDPCSRVSNCRLYVPKSSV